MADLGTYRRTLLPLAGGGLAMWLIFTRAAAPHTASQWVGLALAIVGLGGITVARWTLGNSFSVIPQARQLVTQGIYAKLRNPIYVSGTVFIAGLFLIVGNPWLWVVLAALIVMQVFRARKEAAVLEAKFGDEYRRYREHTWF